MIRILTVLIVCFATTVGCNKSNNAEVEKEKARADTAAAEAQAAKAELAKEKARADGSAAELIKQKSRADAAEGELAKLKAAQAQPKPVDADRQAAEWALRADAHSVNVLAEGITVEIPRGGKVPDAPFSVIAINLTGCRKVTDNGTERLKGLKNIRDLNLDGTSITKLDFLDDMVNLEVLILQNTAVTDEAVAHIKGLTKLKYLNLGMFFGNERITDASLENINGLKQLHTLIVFHCKITDAGLQHLKGHGELRSLHLQQNQLTDASVESLKSLPKLEFLQVGATQITDTGVKSLQAALPKCKIMK